jgi:aspartyl-tRNA synthetase
VRARIHTLRETSKLLFITFRQAHFTVQGVVAKSTSALLFKWAGSLPKETVVDITAAVSAVPSPIASATQSLVELQVSKMFVISRANPLLPFQLEDASRSDALFDEQAKAEAEAAAEGKPAPERKFASVTQDLRLDYRWIDLRTPANQAIMRISSGVCQLFREYLLSQNFVEIQTPKILGGASEGGSSVFTLKYFGDDACLAQSPQLYKQMAAACSDLERVFEIGPVFRAENSNTHRHLCEFHGLDIEMVINEHYFEVLDVFSDLFIFIFDGLNARYRKEIEAVRAQHPFEDLKYHKPSLRMTYAEGLGLLRAAGWPMVDGDDLSTAQEKALGAIVKEKYGTDFFMMDKYPSSIRPFYTMPDPENPVRVWPAGPQSIVSSRPCPSFPYTRRHPPPSPPSPHPYPFQDLSNSYDFFVRGEEIVSGAQRIHDPVMLAKEAERKGTKVSTIQSYVDSFKHGALPHGGGGVGLERVVMLFLGLGNIRKASMFPRDPKRLFP